MEKIDLRVIKTQNTIFEALLSLMKEKPFEDIKVSDICNKALINRSTFYAHYQDKYELLKEAIDYLKNSLIEELNKNTSINNTKEYYIEMISLLLDFIDNKRDIYLNVMINNRNSIVLDIIYDVIDSDITSHLSQKKEGNIPNNIVAKFYIGAVFNVGLEWIEHSNKYKKEDIIKYLDTLIPDSINF